MERKDTSILSLEDRALKALVDDPNGAALEILQLLSGLVINGSPIDPDFQKVANAIITQAVMFGSLPPKRRGRPKDVDSLTGLNATAMYFQLVDGGAGYAEAVAKVSEAFHKDERQIMRMVRSNRTSVGATAEERERKRKWWKICLEMSEGRSPLAFYEKVLADEREEFAKRDLWQELEDQIDAVLLRRFPATDTK